VVHNTGFQRDNPPDKIVWFRLRPGVLLFPRFALEFSSG